MPFAVKQFIAGLISLLAVLFGIGFFVTGVYWLVIGVGYLIDFYPVPLALVGLLVIVAAPLVLDWAGPDEEPEAEAKENESA